LKQIETLSDQEALPLIEKQRAAYDKEVGRLNKIINSSLKTSAAYKDAEKQRAPLIGYILRLDRMGRRIKADLHPDGRPELPCLSPDTLVITAAGPVAIGSLREGDTLLTWDPSSGVTLQGVVLEVHRRMTLSFVEVRAGGVDIRATGRHPFWVVEQGDWISASNLNIGDHLLMADGSLLPIESLQIVEAAGASTVDLSISPYSTYFVGPGVLVHNTPVRHYSAFWQDDKGNTVQPGPYQIYLGTNKTDSKWSNSIYVGQTVQDYLKREDDHQKEAEKWLKKNPNGEKENPQTFRFFSFKKDIKLEVIADGLRTDDQADWLEQENITFEEGLGRDVLNRIDVVAQKKIAGLKDRIKADPIVIASKLC
jgi:hypothetical protein